ncbi:hypothetical protein B0T24DRAFT_182350 [Lasiosphaeria ovina]|uniref:Secreted protein n=1 Tax=Lasiosphaeria ovina TaxID=92902 RepID=A0AAE0NEM8_9PEZI|nr:hypothetical protein B0T24DRAFT_182350 [Lasiosphaeria ovina]
MLSLSLCCLPCLMLQLQIIANHAEANSEQCSLLVRMCGHSLTELVSYDYNCTFTHRGLDGLDWTGPGQGRWYCFIWFLAFPPSLSGAPSLFRGLDAA